MDLHGPLFARPLFLFCLFVQAFDDFNNLSPFKWNVYRRDTRIRTGVRQSRGETRAANWNPKGLR